MARIVGTYEDVGGTGRVRLVLVGLERGKCPVLVLGSTTAQGTG
jgi:hypothetical protein